MVYFVEYNPSCRDCGVIDRISHLIQFISTDIEYDDYKSMTEYEFSVILEERLINFSPCRNCGSSNLSAQNIKIGDYKIYDFDKMIEVLKAENHITNLLILDLQKNYGEIELKVAGKSRNESDFISECMVKVNLLLNESPSRKFVLNRTDGNFQIVISGINIEGKHKLRIHRIINYGFSKEEIRSNLNKYFFENML